MKRVDPVTWLAPAETVPKSKEVAVRLQNCAAAGCGAANQPIRTTIPAIKSLRRRTGPIGRGIALQICVY